MELLSVFVNTAEQKILNFLAQNTGRSFFDKEVAQKTGVSRGATNQTLKDLTGSKLIFKETRGRMNFYQANAANPVLKAFKVLENIIRISSMIEKLKEKSEKIILFGSASRGENYKDSDIDIFVLTHDAKEAAEIIKKFPFKSLRPIFKAPSEFAIVEKKDRIFYQEIIKGVTLWEKYD